LWAQTYPRDATPTNNLGIIYMYLGQLDKALPAAREALRLEPGSASAFANLATTYVSLSRLDEAKATAREAQAHNLAALSIHLILYVVDFLQHEAAGMEHEAAPLMGKPGYEDLMLYFESETAAYGGEFAKARELTQSAADSAQRVDDKEGAAGYKVEAAVREALAGNMALAKQAAQAALAFANGKGVEAYSAIALGLAGDSAQAERLAADLSKRFPEHTIVQTQYLPMIHAAVELQRGDAGKAVEALMAAAPYELGSQTKLPLCPVYLRGDAYLALKQAVAAAGEFQKILDHSGAVGNNVIGALAHLGLGRAYVLAGDSAKAKIAYQDFFALWKNADPAVPILLQAKAEYAKFQ
jgi:eukaryotic-like serine/threonine-protein kinase